MRWPKRTVPTLPKRTDQSSALRRPLTWSVACRSPRQVRTPARTLCQGSSRRGGTSNPCGSRSTATFPTSNRLPGTRWPRGAICKRIHRRRRRRRRRRSRSPSRYDTARRNAHGCRCLASWLRLVCQLAHGAPTHGGRLQPWCMWRAGVRKRAAHVANSLPTSRHGRTVQVLNEHREWPPSLPYVLPGAALSFYSTCRTSVVPASRSRAIYQLPAALVLPLSTLPAARASHSRANPAPCGVVLRCVASCRKTNPRCSGTGGRTAQPGPIRPPCVLPALAFHSTCRTSVVPASRSRVLCQLPAALVLPRYVLFVLLRISRVARSPS